MTHLRSYRTNPGGDVRHWERDSLRLPPSLGVVGVPSADGHVRFLDEKGQVVRQLQIGVKVNDICVDDIDGDGEPEILVAADDCRLRCLTPSGEERFVFAPEREKIVNSSLHLGRNQAVYTFTAECDPDAGKIICVATGDQRLHGLDATGKRLWCFWSYAGIFGVHAMVDMDGDGIREIAGGNPHLSSGDTVYFLKGGDTFAHRILLDGWGATLNSLIVCDLDGDGQDELVAGTGRGSVRALRPRGDEALWHQQMGDVVTGVDVIRDGNGDALLIAGSRSGFVVAFSGDGTKRWSTAVGGPVSHLAATATAQGDVVVAALSDGTVAALTCDGQVSSSSTMPTGPTAMSVVGSRDAALILVAGSDGRIHAYGLPQ